MKAYKSVTQGHAPNSDLGEDDVPVHGHGQLLHQIGLREGTHNMKRLCGLCYCELRDCDILSSYNLCAISQAAGILASREQSLCRGRSVRDQVVRRPYITNCYGVRHNGCLPTSRTGAGTRPAYCWTGTPRKPSQTRTSQCAHSR